MKQLEVAARSHSGWRRPTNEDSAYAGPSLVLVADGVGGAAAGEVASTVAATTLADLAARHPDADPAVLLREAVDRAGSTLRRHVADHPDAVGLGTTLTALLTDGSRVGLAHLGDSRAYLLRRGRLHRLTADHSWARAMVDGGHVTEEQAARSPYRHRLVRWLGADDPSHGYGRPDVGHLELVVGDRVLLASDGLTDEVDDVLLARLLSVSRVGDAVELLVTAALAAGGRDNVTCVVADVVDRPHRRCDGVLVGAAASAATRLPTAAPAS